MQEQFHSYESCHFFHLVARLESTRSRAVMMMSRYVSKNAARRSTSHSAWPLSVSKITDPGVDKTMSATIATTLFFLLFSFPKYGIHFHLLEIALAGDYDSNLS
eukprot:scaffold13448_cov180-Amphora_coffeaeformis.AAC.3